MQNELTLLEKLKNLRDDLKESLCGNDKATEPYSEFEVLTSVYSTPDGRVMHTNKSDNSTKLDVLIRNYRYERDRERDSNHRYYRCSYDYNDENPQSKRKPYPKRLPLKPSAFKIYKRFYKRQK